MAKVVEEPRTKTVNGHDVLPSNLRTFPWSKDRFAIMDAKSYSILCRAANDTYGTIFHPITFSAENARRWVENGTIGDLQEGLSNLQICFTNRLMDPPRFVAESADQDYNHKKFG